jgi:hypothetical protein
MKLPVYQDLLAVWQKVMGKDGYYDLLKGSEIASVWAQGENTKDSLDNIYIGVTRLGLGQFITIKVTGAIVAAITFDRETGRISFGSADPVLYPRNNEYPYEELTDVGVLFLMLLKLHGIKCIEAITYSENNLYVIHGDKMLSKFALTGNVPVITKITEDKQ